MKPRYCMVTVGTWGWEMNTSYETKLLIESPWLFVFDEATGGISARKRRILYYGQRSGTFVVTTEYQPITSDKRWVFERLKFSSTPNTVTEVVSQVEAVSLMREAGVDHGDLEVAICYRDWPQDHMKWLGFGR